MMGAGFGGCTISLVEAGAVDEFRARVAREYLVTAGKTPNIHVIKVESGTRAL
jgi:galactokinase